MYLYVWGLTWVCLKIRRSSGQSARPNDRTNQKKIACNNFGIYGCVVIGTPRSVAKHTGNDRLSLFSIKYIRQLLKISLRQMHSSRTIWHLHKPTHTQYHSPILAGTQHVAVARPFLHNGITTFDSSNMSTMPSTEQRRRPIVVNCVHMQLCT